MNFETWISLHPDNLDMVVCRLCYRLAGYEKSRPYRDSEEGNGKWWMNGLDRIKGQWPAFDAMCYQFPTPSAAVRAALALGYIEAATKAAQRLRRIGIEP